ncbi:10794_t:CDS:2, partial [Gigaspora rosea]
SKVQNTHRSTQNWINKFQEYRSDVGLKEAPEDIDDTSKLETQLCEYFTVAKKSDGSEYTVSSLLSAIRVINSFIIQILARDPSEKGYGETNGSDSLSFEEIQCILQHETTSRDTTNYSSIKVWCKKIQFGQLKLKIFMRVLAEKTGINCEDRKITNQAGRKTLVQLLKNIGANDYEVSTITRHRSLSGIASYERPKDGVQKSALANLMNAMESNINTKISQNQSPVTLPTKDTYQGFKSARQIIKSANSHGFQGSIIPLQELPPIPNQNHKCKDFFKGICL